MYKYRLLVDNNGSIETSEFVNNAQKADFSEFCDLLFDLKTLKDVIIQNF